MPVFEHHRKYWVCENCLLPANQGLQSALAYETGAAYFGENETHRRQNDMGWHCRYGEVRQQIQEVWSEVPIYHQDCHSN
jgi:hypothetical protein